MKTETLIFVILNVFFLITTPTYWLLSHEITGTVALILTFFLTVIVSAYLGLTGRRLPPRPEDQLDGEIEDGVGQIGFFSPQSVWPLWAGIAFALVVLGVVIGWWLLIIAFAFLIMAVIGFTFEYYREVPGSPTGASTGH